LISKLKKVKDIGAKASQIGYIDEKVYNKLNQLTKKNGNMSGPSSVYYVNASLVQHFHHITDKKKTKREKKNAHGNIIILINAGISFDKNNIFPS
jgi:hypothetical protein